MNDMDFDSDYMTFEEFIERARKDLNDPNFFVYDYPTPKNEEDYQELLKLIRSIK